MPSRAAKAERRRRQSERDKARHLEEAEHAERMLQQRLLLEQFHDAEDQFEARHGIKKVYAVREDTMRACVVIADRAHIYARPEHVPPWFHPSLTGREPLEVGLRDTPPNKDWRDQSQPWDYDHTTWLEDDEWPQKAEVEGLVAAVETLADWLDWSGDRSIIPAVLALGGLQAAIPLVGE